jgi:virginiamycin B lyase
VGEIGIGTDVHDVATGFGAVWVADGTDGTVTRIDPKLNTVEKTIRLEPENETPEPVFWIATGAGAVWATHGNTVVQIDPATNLVRSRVDIPAPTGLTAGLGAAWVVTQNQRLVEIRPGSNRVRTRAIGRRFHFEADALAPIVGAGSLWLIVYRGTGEIWRIDPRSDAVSRITTSTSRYPLDIAVPDSGDAVWAVDVTGAVIRLNPEVGLVTAKIATAPTIRSALAVGHGATWVAVQD